MIKNIGKINLGKYFAKGPIEVDVALKRKIRIVVRGDT